MIVIADDITGAAEIAGIAFSLGQPVRLICAGSVGGADGSACETSAVTTVIATDTRSMTAAEAVAETRRVCEGWKHRREEGRRESQSDSLPSFPPSLFKKTDSALRGHVVEELSALLQATGYRRAVYLPANPSKGRVIRGGVYYIQDTPIAETAFSYDPEFPAKTSVLRERFPDAEARGIVMPDAESVDDIRRVVSQYHDGQTLFAGAADLFAAVLAGVRGNGPHTAENSPRPQKSTLILCGSTQSSSLDLGIPVAPMPRTVYDGAADLSQWDTTAYQERHSLILSIPHTHRTGKAVAVHLRTMMARMACRLIDVHRPDQLIIEGGATAWATLQALDWTRFDVERQVAPGVVQMRAQCGTLVTLKPGSYPWGGLFGSAQ